MIVRRGAAGPGKRAHPALLLVALLLSSLPAPARAYVRTITDTGAPMRWADPTVQVVVYLGTPPRSLNHDLLVAAVTGAAAAWGRGTQTCTGLSLELRGAEEATAPAADDRVNRVTFRRERWRREPCAVDRPQDCTVYDPEALAITSVLAVRRTGEIVDSDMELNAVDKVWADVLATPPSEATGPLFDLQNTLTHEFGHLIGLDHNCTDAATRGVPVDHLGQLAPACARATAEQRAATMFNQAGSGDIGKRDLAPDDIQAVCEIYPAGQGVVDLSGPGATESGGCALSSPAGADHDQRAPRSAGPLALITLIGLAFEIARRRRRR